MSNKIKTKHIVQNQTHPASDRIQKAINQKLLEYCQRWLTEKDEYQEISFAFFSKLDHPLFQRLPPHQRIDWFKQSILEYPTPQFDQWTINLAQLHSVSPYSGSFAARQDFDGKIRRHPLFFRTGNKLGVSFVPALALQTYLAAHPEYQALIEIAQEQGFTHVITGHTLSDRSETFLHNVGSGANFL